MIQEVVGQLPPESTQQAVGYPSLFLLVALGAWCRWCRRARW